LDFSTLSRLGAGRVRVMAGKRRLPRDRDPYPPLTGRLADARRVGVAIAALCATQPADGARVAHRVTSRAPSAARGAPARAPAAGWAAVPPSALESSGSPAFQI